MLKQLARLFSSSRQADPAASRPRVPVRMHWFADTRLPIPDWSRIAEDEAAEHHLGFPIAHLVEAVLGEGPWEPRPETWREGVERGQFAPFPRPAT